MAQGSGAARAAAALLTLAAGTAAAQPAEGYRWRTLESGGGCEASASEVPGKPYVAARAVCTIPASVDVLAAVLEDIERYPEWMQDCAETRVLKVVDRDRDAYVFWFRQHVTLFRDRDMVLRSETVVRDGRRRVVRAWSTQELPYDPGKGYVRMPSFFSEWVLEALDDGRTRVTFLVDPDPAPGLPLGIANSTIQGTPLRSLRGLARMARLARYVDGARAAAARPPLDALRPASP
jgi:hypothetical protein